jgi:hypothetical protein
MQVGEESFWLLYKIDDAAAFDVDSAASGVTRPIASLNGVQIQNARQPEPHASGPFYRW